MRSAGGGGPNAALDEADRLSLTGHRPDVQGLRAVAVLLVAFNHAGVGFLGGGYIGVDVFFVLSGYLITGLLVTGARRDGRVSLGDFYARRARRILPAATLTLVTTAIAAYYLLNVVRAKQALTDVIWGALFAANVRATSTATNYFSQGQPPSPVQHFWSLAVEEQFYIVWPTVLAVVLFGWVLVRIAQHRQQTRPEVSERAMLRLLAFVVLIVGTSLYWSIHQTQSDPTVAYFSTFTRAWELAANHKIELVPTPTYASYLNPVECRFSPIAEFVFKNADYLDWDAANWALARHIQHRNGPHRDHRLRTLEARHQTAA